MSEVFDSDGTVNARCGHTPLMDAFVEAYHKETCVQTYAYGTEWTYQYDHIDGTVAVSKNE